MMPALRCSTISSSKLMIDPVSAITASSSASTRPAMEWIWSRPALMLCPSLLIEARLPDERDRGVLMPGDLVDRQRIGGERPDLGENRSPLRRGEHRIFELGGGKDPLRRRRDKELDELLGQRRMRRVFRDGRAGEVHMRAPALECRW